MKNYILALDPSNKATAYVLIDIDGLVPVDCGFKDQDAMLFYISHGVHSFIKGLIGNYGHYSIYFAIEGMQNLGMPSGKSVFDTCYLIGRILERVDNANIYGNLLFNYTCPRIIYRKEEKMNLCGTMRCKDKDIKQALADRFALGVPNYGKGTKHEKGIFWNFKADIFQAYAVGITYYDLYYKGMCF